MAVAPVVEAGGAADLPEGAMCAVHGELGASFLCSRCGSFGCPGCAFASTPKAMVCAACAASGMGTPVPWELRKSVGIVRAFFRTTSAASRTPTRFFRTPSTDGSVGSAVVYGVAAYAFGQYVSIATMALAMTVGGIAMAAGTNEPMIGAFAGGYSVVLVGMVLVQAPVYGLLGILLGGGLVHGTLALMKKTSAGFEQTLRAVSYANAPYVFYAIPCVGPLVAWFWMIGVEVIAVRETHRIGTDRALVAVLGYRLLLVTLVIGGYALLFAAIYLLERPR